MSANIFNAGYVVRHNAGQYVEMQEAFFRTKAEAEKFVRLFRKMNPHGAVALHEWCCHTQTIVDRKGVTA